VGNFGSAQVGKFEPVLTLYEFLVQFRIADTLSSHLSADWKWRVIRSQSFKLLQDAPLTGVASLGNGKARIELRTQQIFSPTKTANIESGFVSLAGKRIPDYILGIFDQENNLRSWLILDAKFRTKKEYVQWSAPFEWSRVNVSA
jgi:hypothetical protein